MNDHLNFYEIIIQQAKQEQKTFQDLNNANAINFQIEKAETYICKKIEEIDITIHSFIKFLEKMGGEK